MTRWCCESQIMARELRRRTFPGPGHLDSLACENALTPGEARSRSAGTQTQGPRSRSLFRLNTTKASPIPLQLFDGRHITNSRQANVPYGRRQDHLLPPGQDLAPSRHPLPPLPLVQPRPAFPAGRHTSPIYYHPIIEEQQSFPFMGESEHLPCCPSLWVL
jgi:hypothetical protein